MAPKIRVKRQPSVYNIFMNKRLAEIKCEDPTLDHKEAFMMAAHEWKDSPENPANKINLDVFMKRRIAEIEHDDPTLDHEEAYKMAAHEWKDFSENPDNKKNLDDESEEKSLKKKVTKQHDDCDLDNDNSDDEKTKKKVMISDSDDDSDDGFSELNISKSDLKLLNLGTKDRQAHYYHKKNNCIYSKDEKWHKHEGSLQKQLLKRFEELEGKEKEKKPKKKVTKLNNYDDNDSEPDDDLFDKLNISKDDLKELDIGNKDLDVYYYNKKDKCIYCKSLENNEWSKTSDLRKNRIIEICKTRKIVLGEPKKKIIEAIKDIEESNSESDDDIYVSFEELNILKNDLIKLNLKTKDCCVHYYHTKEKCMYSNFKTNKWFKPCELLQKQLREICVEHGDECGVIFKNTISKKKTDSDTQDEKPVKRKK